MVNQLDGGDSAAAAMIDRIVHHADVISLEGASDRAEDRDPGCLPTVATDE